MICPYSVVAVRSRPVIGFVKRVSVDALTQPGPRQPEEGCAVLGCAALRDRSKSGVSSLTAQGPLQHLPPPAGQAKHIIPLATAFNGFCGDSGSREPCEKGCLDSSTDGGGGLLPFLFFQTHTHAHTHTHTHMLIKHISFLTHALSLWLSNSNIHVITDQYTHIYPLSTHAGTYISQLSPNTHTNHLIFLCIYAHHHHTHTHIHRDKIKIKNIYTERAIKISVQ